MHQGKFLHSVSLLNWNPHEKSCILAIFFLGAIIKLYILLSVKKLSSLHCKINLSHPIAHKVVVWQNIYFRKFLPWLLPHNKVWLIRNIRNRRQKERRAWQSRGLFSFCLSHLLNSNQWWWRQAARGEVGTSEIMIDHNLRWRRKKKLSKRGGMALTCT